MPHPILYPELRRLLDEGAQLVEVLPPEEYAEERLPRAINIPLKQLDAETTAHLDKRKPIVVYCWDALCDMSPRAATRLDTLGFEQVYDYVPGKVDWLARGLPREGEKAGEPRAADVARDDVVTARLDERLGDVRPLVQASPYDFAFVVSEGGALLGRLRKAQLEGHPNVRAEDVMEPGPSTVRADTPLDKLRERLDGRGLKTAVVTTPDGALLGVVRRGDL